MEEETMLQGSLIYFTIKGTHKRMLSTEENTSQRETPGTGEDY